MLYPYFTLMYLTTGASMYAMCRLVLVSCVTLCLMVNGGWDESSDIWFAGSQDMVQ